MTIARGYCPAVRRRRAILSLVLLLALVATAAAAGPKVTLPRDHFGHRAGIEWWYITGYVRGQNGARYSVFFTLFKRAGFVLPVSQVVDLDSGALIGHTETVAPRALGASSLDVRAPGARLHYVQRTNTWTFAARQGQYALSLTATPTKPYVLHGGTGYIRQSTAGVSGYYSATRMTARGTITAAGKAIGFSGEAWLDHQWGNFATDPRALLWDWFSCRFDDRTELMLYRFRGLDGAPLTAYRTGTYVLRSGKARTEKAFDVIAGSRALDAAGRMWPLDWELRLPAEQLDLKLTSIVDDQLVRSTVLPTFYEGAATATGSKIGICFVEQSYG
jgi:predicted secreted hydrolase